MMRPTIREQQIIKARNELIKKLVKEGYKQAEVGKFFKVNRSTVNLIVNEAV